MSTILGCECHEVDGQHAAWCPAHPNNNKKPAPPTPTDAPEPREQFDAESWLRANYPNAGQNAIWDTNNQQIARDAYAAGVAARASGEAGQPKGIQCEVDLWKKVLWRKVDGIYDLLREVVSAKAAPSSSEAARLNESDILNALVDMTDGVLWKQPEADGHVSRFTELLNKALQQKRTNSQPVRGAGADRCTCVHGDSDPDCDKPGHPGRAKAPTAASEQGEG